MSAYKTVAALSRTPSAVSAPASRPQTPGRKCRFRFDADAQRERRQQRMAKLVAQRLLEECDTGATKEEIVREMRRGTALLFVPEKGRPQFHLVQLDDREGCDGTVVQWFEEKKRACETRIPLRMISALHLAHPLQRLHTAFLGSVSLSISYYAEKKGKGKKGDSFTRHTVHLLCKSVRERNLWYKGLSMLTCKTGEHEEDAKWNDIFVEREEPAPQEPPMHSGTAGSINTVRQVMEFYHKVQRQVHDVRLPKSVRLETERSLQEVRESIFEAQSRIGNASYFRAGIWKSKVSLDCIQEKVKVLVAEVAPKKKGVFW